MNPQNLHPDREYDASGNFIGFCLVDNSGNIVQHHVSGVTARINEYYRGRRIKANPIFAEYGTRIHNEISEYIQTGASKSRNADVQRATWELSQKYPKSAGWKLKSNVLVSDGQGKYVSEIDCLAVNDRTREVQVVDFKTAKVIRQREYNAQLALYKAMIAKQMPGYNISGTYLLKTHEEHSLKPWQETAPVSGAELDEILYGQNKPGFVRGKPLYTVPQKPQKWTRGDPYAVFGKAPPNANIDPKSLTTSLDIETGGRGEPISVTAIKYGYDSTSKKWVVASVFQNYYKYDTRGIGTRKFYESVAVNGLPPEGVLALGATHGWSAADARMLMRFIGSSQVVGHNIWGGGQNSSLGFDLRKLFSWEQIQSLRDNGGIFDTYMFAQDIANLQHRDLDSMIRFTTGKSMAEWKLTHHDATPDAVGGFLLRLGLAEKYPLAAVASLQGMTYTNFNEFDIMRMGGIPMTVEDIQSRLGGNSGGSSGDGLELAQALRDMTQSMVEAYKRSGGQNTAILNALNDSMSSQLFSQTASKIALSKQWANTPEELRGAFQTMLPQSVFNELDKGGFLNLAIQQKELQDLAKQQSSMREYASQLRGRVLRAQGGAGYLFQRPDKFNLEQDVFKDAQGNWLPLLEIKNTLDAQYGEFKQFQLEASNADKRMGSVRFQSMLSTATDMSKGRGKRASLGQQALHELQAITTEMSDEEASAHLVKAKNLIEQGASGPRKSREYAEARDKAYRKYSRWGYTDEELAGIRGVRSANQLEAALAKFQFERKRDRAAQEYENKGQHEYARGTHKARNGRELEELMDSFEQGSRDVQTFSSNIIQAGRALENLGGALSGIAHAFSQLPILANMATHSSVVQGMNKTLGAMQGIIPDPMLKILRRVEGAGEGEIMYNAALQDWGWEKQLYKAKKRQSTLGAWAAGLRGVGSTALGVGGAMTVAGIGAGGVGAIPGLIVTGAGAALSGAGAVVGGIGNMGVGLVNKRRSDQEYLRNLNSKYAGQYASERLYGNINKIGIGVDYILGPFRLLGNAARMLWKVFGNLTGVVAGLGNLGHPITGLTGVGYGSYGGLMNVDWLAGLSPGTTNGVLEGFSTAQQLLYNTGRMDMNRVVASALTGTFGSVYAPGGNTQKQFASTVDTLYARMRRPGQAQSTLALAGQIDSNLPRILTALDKLSITNPGITYSQLTADVHSRTNALGMYVNPLTDREAARGYRDSTQLNMAKTTSTSILQRIGMNAWESFGARIFNTFNKWFDKLERAIESSGIWKWFGKLADTLEKGDFGGAWDMIKNGVRNAISAIDWKPLISGATKALGFIFNLWNMLLSGVAQIFDRLINIVDDIRINDPATIMKTHKIFYWQSERDNEEFQRIMNAPEDTVGLKEGVYLVNRKTGRRAVTQDFQGMPNTDAWQTGSIWRHHGGGSDQFGAQIDLFGGLSTGSPASSGTITETREDAVKKWIGRVNKLRDMAASILATESYADMKNGDLWDFIRGRVRGGEQLLRDVYTDQYDAQDTYMRKYGERSGVNYGGKVWPTTVGMSNATGLIDGMANAFLNVLNDPFKFDLSATFEVKAADNLGKVSADGQKYTLPNIFDLTIGGIKTSYVGNIRLENAVDMQGVGGQ